MTATHISPLPSASTGAGLVCRPLVVMASRGFDRVCLLQMQESAFRYAAQSLQNNKSSHASALSLDAIVDQQLGGAGHPRTDLSPGHIAAYMRAKAFLSQLPQRGAMFDVAVLATAELAPGQATGPFLGWLAHTLVQLRRDADRLATATATPIFASEIAAQVRGTTEKRADISLASAMQVVTTRAATTRAPHPDTRLDEDQMDNDEYPRTSP